MPYQPPPPRFRSPRRGRGRKRYGQIHVWDQYHGAMTLEHLPWTVPPDERQRWALARKRRAWVRRQMREGLPAAQRTVVELYYFRYKTFRECAAELDIHASTAQRLLVRAIRRLRQKARSAKHLWPEGSDYGPKP